jgi:hypothetical protein
LSFQASSAVEEIALLQANSKEEAIELLKVFRKFAGRRRSPGPHAFSFVLKLPSEHFITRFFPDKSGTALPMPAHYCGVFPKTHTNSGASHQTTIIERWRSLRRFGRGLRRDLSAS